MTDNTWLAVDLSSNNGAVDLKKHWDAGHRILILKVTEGTSYVWQQSHVLAAQWHSYGGVVWHYHFLSPGDGAAQADWFWDHVKNDRAVGDLFVVDVETKGDTGAEVNTFIDRVRVYDSRQGLIYGSPSFLTTNQICKHAGWWLWLAEYGPKTDVPPSWAGWAAWQFTDRGAAAGVTGGVDVSQVKPWTARVTVRLGDRAWPVLLLKQRLHQLGYGGLVMNDKYGFGLRRAVAKFKRDRRLHNQDGRVCGATMWAALYK